MDINMRCKICGEWTDYTVDYLDTPMASETVCRRICSVKCAIEYFRFYAEWDKQHISEFEKELTALLRKYRLIDNKLKNKENDPMWISNEGVK